LSSSAKGARAAGAAVIWLLLAGVGVNVPLAFLKPGLLGLFIAGMLVALVVHASRWVPCALYAVALGIGGFIGLGATASFIGTGVEIDKPTWVMGHGLSAVFVVFGLATLERQGWSPRWPAGIALGDASYVLYLVHWPIISFICTASVRAGLSGLPGATLAWLVLLHHKFRRWFRGKRRMQHWHR
jgi:exopolysaccharide production protein ExoZ